ncbi:xanthine dehydrogenase family protein molybdopterin-binding subunit, partial [Cetobacterium sp.]
GAFRGYGATQGTFAVESIINELAHHLKLDPTEVRMKNLVEPGEGKYITSGDIKKCIEIGKEKFNWAEKSIPREVAPNKIRAAGMAVTMQGSGIGGIDTAAATIKLGDRGDFNLMVGVTDMGQGCDTVLTQMAAEVLEVPMDRISIHSADTDLSPYDPGAYASSGTYVTGNAVIIAANNMKEEILKGASKMFNVEIGDIDYLGTELKIADKIISLEEFAQRSISFEGMNQITTTGTWGGETSPPPFIAGFAEVEVDTLTGEVEVTDYLSVVDCGTPINPNLVQVQVEGGAAQGIGLALFEDIKYDKKGRVMTDSLMQYKIPSRLDCKNIRVEFSNSYEKTGPFGAKSVGEVVVNTPAPAIVDAVYNATKVRVRNLPVTSEKVLMGILDI